MRRLAKAPSVGSTHAAPGPGGLVARLTLALAAAMLALAAFAGVASAASAGNATFASEFACEAGHLCNGASSWAPGRLAVDEATGHVYVIDNEHDAVDVFDSAGTYLSQLKVPVAGGGTFAFAPEADIAVDNTGGTNAGNVYVAAAGGGGKVFGFDPGAVEPFLWAKTNSEPCGVGVDTNGNVWASNFMNGLQKLNPATGAEEGSPIITGIGNCWIDFGPEERAYVSIFGAGLKAYNYGSETFLYLPTNSTNNDVAVDRQGGPIYIDFGTQVTAGDTSNSVNDVNLLEFGSGKLSESLGIAVDSAAHKAYVADSSAKKVYVYDLPYALSVAKTGSGEVISDVPGVSCGASPISHCLALYEPGETVTLTAIPPAHKMVSWSGCTPVAGHPGECEVDMSGNVKVGAEFVQAQHTLTVTPTGTGSGSVSADSGSIAGCEAGGGTCSGLYDEESTVTLTATLAPHATVAWSGCTPVAGHPDECEIEIEEEDAEVSAAFTAEASGGGEEGGGGSTGGGSTGGGSTGGSGGGSTGGGNPTPTPTPKPLTCKKGFVEKKVHGKARCVRKHKKHHHKKHHHKKQH